MVNTYVIGHMDWHSNNMIGAVVKARSVYEELCEELGSAYVKSVDIYNWRKRKIQVIIFLIKAFVESKNIVLVCSDTSRMLMLMFSFLKFLLRNRIHYCVVGGDIADLLSQSPKQVKTLKCVDCFYVETIDCLEDLKGLGISNVELLRNFKRIIPIKKEEIQHKEYEEPFKFCTFSRVIEQKGIGDAAVAVSEINSVYGREICHLDVYGPVDETYVEEFNNEIVQMKCVTYKGIIEANQSVNVLKEYYCLLFPTKYQTEGIPGTIVDGFAAGLPVICSNWKRCEQIVTDGRNGIVYDFGNTIELKNKIQFAIENKDYIKQLRFGALKEFELYKPQIAIKPLIENLSR